MGAIADLWTRFGAWLFPGLAVERDLALEKVAYHAQQLQEATDFAAQLAIENRRLQTLVEAAQKPEPPKILRPATTAEVRRITEQAFAVTTEES